MSKSAKKKVFVLDSAAILNNFSFYFNPKNSYFMTPEVVAEMKDLRSKMLIDDALHRCLLKIKEPKEKTLAQVEGQARELGLTKLSNADISIIALAKEMKRRKITVVTDDYAVQNLLEILGITYQPVLMEGIRERLAFQNVCESCGKKFKASYANLYCDVCGGGIVKRKKRI